MLPNIEQPLTPEQIEQLKEARKLIPKLREQIRRAKTAGLDVSQFEAEIADLEGRLQGLLNVYGQSTGIRKSS